MSFWGIVVAAGEGRRFGGIKHHIEIGGSPLWVRAADALRAGGAAGVVVVGDVPDGVPGGRRRRDSVAAGLAGVPESAPYVLVHDAARPLADAALVQRVVARLERGDADGVVPVIAVRDTLKRVAADRVDATIDRSALVAAQTPQGFVTAVLRAAHAADDEDATDDAALVERHGGTVVTVPGDAANVKVTYPDDYFVVEALYRARGEARR